MWRNHAVLALLAVVLFLFVVGWGRQVDRKKRAVWLVLSAWLFGLGCVLLVCYLAVRSYHVVELGRQAEFLVGLWMDSNWVKHNPDLAELGSQVIVRRISIQTAYEQVWSGASLMWSYLLNMTLYVVSVLCILGSMFCVTEGYFSKVSRVMK